MADEKARCATCRVEFKAKKDGFPYAHKCVPDSEDPNGGLREDCPTHGKPEQDDGFCSTEDGSTGHSFTWNAQAGESQCIGCGEPDTASAKLARTHTHSYNWADDDNGHSGSYCACGQEEPDTAAAKAARVTEHQWTDSTGVVWVHRGAREECGVSYCQRPPQPAEPDPWDDPTPPAGPKLNASGQPDARYEWHGKQNRGYLVKDPRTGDFRRYKNGNVKGWTRATTFNKAATDQNSLTDWAKRNVLIGASRRPDVVGRAHGLTHEDHKPQLMDLVGELETAAGAKVSAQIGTDIHELTERWDGGQLKPEDIPAQYRPMIELYDQTLKAAGLRAVPGLIERTTCILEFGGVVGTMDRVYLHEASGQYLIGDVKTGKTLKYGMDEIETQEWIYAHGVNENGVYDWNTDQWHRPWEGQGIPNGWPPLHRVSEEWGIVVHLPVQGPDAPVVAHLVRADLQRGKRHAQVCHDVRVQRSSKPKPEPWTGDELKAPEKPFDPYARVRPEKDTPWDWAFCNVSSVESAGALWEKAKAAGVTGLELNRLVGLAQQRLRELGIST